MAPAGVSDAVVEGCSGALGSVASLLITYPLKTIYTLQALSTGSGGASLPADSAVLGEPKALALLRFLQAYKLSSLYAGLGPNIIESALSSGVYFFFYSKLRDQAVAWSRRRSGSDAALGAAAAGGGPRSESIGVLASLLVATSAGAINQLITLPASVVATRMQGYQSIAKQPGAPQRPPTTLETIAAVWREGGLGAFWKGLLPSMILLINPAVQYMLFEKIKGLLRYWKARRVAAAAAAADADAEALERRAAATAAAAAARRCSADSDDAMQNIEAAVKAAKAAAAPARAPESVQLSAGEVFLAGALAKIGATIVSYPLIVVKARQQAASGPSKASTWGVISSTARNEGLGGFFKGLRAKILQTALNAALMLMLKEQFHGATKTALNYSLGAGSSAPVAPTLKRMPAAAPSGPAAAAAAKPAAVVAAAVKPAAAG